MEIINGIPCIEANKLWNSGVMSYDMFQKMKQRGQLRVVRRGCLGTTALVDRSSIPEHFRKLMKEKCAEEESTNPTGVFESHIINDEAARTFFRAHRLDDGRGLPVETIEEYCANASILNALREVSSSRAAQRKLMGNSKGNIWDKLSEDVNNLDKTKYPHDLPGHVRRLRNKYSKFFDEDGGYKILIHPNFCNKNTEKVSDNAKIWLLAQWANRVDICPSIKQLTARYNKEADARGWIPVKSEQTIYNFIYREDIQELWWGHRYGELKAKEKFSPQNKTLLPTMRDSLWYSDGTKLNYYYLTEDGKRETCTVYEVMDVYSEVFLGYFISKSEDFEAQFRSFKMALQFSGQKPYEIRYDNQGGHKKLENGNFLQQVAHLSIHTAPYNGKSKTIENAFYRYQADFLKRDWFFTGQNIQAKQTESRENQEFILANQSNLPSLEEVKQRYKLRRDEWNNAPHFKTGISRIEMYRNSINPKSTKLDMMDLVDIFWIQRKEQITCNAYGISFTEKKNKYDFMVYKESGRVDVEWMRKNIDKKFTVRFDPDDMSLIYLYEKTASGLRFVTAADMKIVTHRGKQEQEEWEASYMKLLELDNKKARIATRDKMDAILEEHGLLPEQNGLISPLLKGIEKKEKVNSGEISKYQKAVSYAELDENLDPKDIWGII